MQVECDVYKDDTIESASIGNDHKGSRGGWSVQPQEAAEDGCILGLVEYERNDAPRLQSTLLEKCQGCLEQTRSEAQIDC